MRPTQLGGSARKKKIVIDFIRETAITAHLKDRLIRRSPWPNEALRKAPRAKVETL